MDEEERAIETEIIEQRKLVTKMNGEDEQKILEMQGKNEEEKTRIREEMEKAAEQKKEIEESIKKRQEALEGKRAQRSDLKTMLATMQEKLLVGSEQQAAEREEADRLASELHRAKIEEEERRRQEQRLKEDILQKEEDRDMVEEQFSSLKEEEEVKTKKLKKLMTKLKAAQAEKRDLFGEFQSEKEAMHETIRDLERQLKYSDLLLDNFVPDDFLMKIEEMATWEDIQNEWIIAHEEYSGNKINQNTEQPKGLAEAMGVDVGAEYDYYDPYAMDPQQQFDQQFASVGQDMAMLVQGQSVTSAFLSYSGNGADDDDDESRAVKAKRPKSGSGSRAKSARPKSGRPGSAGKKTRHKDTADVLTGIPGNTEDSEADASTNVPKARGLVAKRPPSARVRTQIPTSAY